MPNELQHKIECSLQFNPRSSRKEIPREVPSEVKKRIEYFDIAKGISMLCIIAGHLPITWVCRLVFTFHVPLFLLISGYFYKQGGLKRRFWQLLIPYIFTSLVLILAYSLKDLLLGLSPIGDIKYLCAATLFGSGSRGIEFMGYNIPIIGATWFILALIWAIICMNIIDKIIDKDSKHLKFLVVVVLFIIALVVSHYKWLPLSILSGLTALLFVFIGNQVKSIKDTGIKLDNKLIFSLSAVLWGGRYILALRTEICH